MIKCYLCPIQDLCTTAEERATEIPVDSAVVLPDYRRDECPLCVLANLPLDILLKGQEKSIKE